MFRPFGEAAQNFFFKTRSNERTHTNGASELLRTVHRMYRTQRVAKSVPVRANSVRLAGRAPLPFASSDTGLFASVVRTHRLVRGHTKRSRIEKDLGANSFFRRALMLVENAPVREQTRERNKAQATASERTNEVDF